MAISETLKLADEVSGPAATMAKAVGGVDKATQGARKSLAALEKSSGQSVKASANVQIKALEKVDQARSKSDAIANQKAKHERDRIGKFTKGIKVAKAALGREGNAAELLGTTGSLALVGAALGVGLLVKGISSAVSAAAKLTAEFAESFAEAVKLRGESKALMDTLTGGRGDKALALIKSQAIATGQSVADLQDQFKRARDAGANNKQALALGNLRADIINSGRSAQEADAAINEMLGKVKAGTKDASKGAAELAVKFGVAGDGVAAVNKQAKTFGGLMNRLKAAPANFLDKLAAGPAGKELDKLGEKATKALNSFLKSPQAAAAMDQIAGAIQSVIAAIGTASELIGPFWEGFRAGIGPVIDLLSPLGDALGEAFSGENADNMNTLKTVATAMGVAFGVAAVAIGAVAAAIGGVLVMTGGAIVAIGALLAAILKISAGAVKAGGDFIIGLVNGIRSGSWDAVKAVKDLATGMISAFTSILKIGSPSKVFEGLGKFTAQGYAQGIDRGSAGVETAARAMSVAAKPVNDNAQPSAPSRSIAMGGLTVNITIQGTGSSAQDAQNIAEKVFSILEGQLIEAAV